MVEREVGSQRCIASRSGFGSKGAFSFAEIVQVKVAEVLTIATERLGTTNMDGDDTDTL